MQNVTMKARDTIAAKLAECFITIGTRRYNFMQMIDMEVKVDKNKVKVPRLGAIMAGNKSVGMEGTFQVLHTITSLFFVRHLLSIRTLVKMCILKCRLPMMTLPVQRADRP